MLLSPRTLHTYIFNYSLLRSNKSWEPPAQASKFRKWTAPQPTSHISAWHDSLMTWSSYIFLTFWWFPRLFVNHQCHQQLPHIPNSTTTKFALFVTDTLICAKQNISFSYIPYVSLCLLGLCSHLFLHRCVSHPSIIHSTTPSPTRRGPGDPMGLQGFRNARPALQFEELVLLFLWPSVFRSHLTSSSNHNLKVRGTKWCGISVLNSQLVLERYFQACYVQLLRVTLSIGLGKLKFRLPTPLWTLGPQDVQGVQSHSFNFRRIQDIPRVETKWLVVLTVLTVFTHPNINQHESISGIIISGLKDIERPQFQQAVEDPHRAVGTTCAPRPRTMGQAFQEQKYEARS
jgi:uncharacterized CHY-type Zn-finger protein